MIRRSSKKETLWCKKLIRYSDVDIDNMVITKLIKLKNMFKYLNGYLHEVIRSLVLILPKMSGYVKSY